MKKILGLTLVFVMLVTALAVLPAAAADEDGYYAYLDQGITLVHRHGGEAYSVSVAAKEIGETKEFTCGCTNSVEDYLLGLIDNADSSAATKGISSALLNYGAAAKAYFGYTGADIFGTPETDTTALKAAKAPEATVEGNEDGIYLGATLVLEGTMQLRFFFASSDVNVNYDGNDQSVFEREGYDYGFFDVPVMPYAMEDYVTLSVTTEAGTTTVKYAPINYLQNMADNAELSEMVASIYAYGEAAFDYYYEGSYVYPMDGIVLANGTIDHSKTYSDKKHNFVAGGGEKIALIDLTDIDYDTVTVTPNLNGETGFVAFLTTMPTTHGTMVNYALNYNDMIAINEPATLVIPENAKYMAVTNNYDDGTSCLPKSIVFSDTVTPLDNLKNDALTTYEYPVDTIKPSQGTIHSASGTFISNFDWISSIVSLEDTVFNQVIFEVGENGCVGYAFLTDYPTIGASIPFATKDVNWSWIEKEVHGTEVAVDIPRNATCMLLCWHEPADEGGHTNFIPASMTFTKEGNVVDPLEELRDNTLPEYEYPMNEVLPAEGAIFYWADGHIYMADANLKAAFIEITDTVFDTVTLTVNSKTGATGWAFLTDMPALGESAPYADGYDTFHWTDKGYSPENIVIPEGANYLVVYYQDSVTEPYYPETITFKQTTYSYPMDQLTSVDGYFNRQNNTSNKTPTFEVSTSAENIAFVDLTNLDYNTVTLLGNANNESGWYTFVTKRPINDGEKISYAMNCSGANWFGLGDGPVTVTIPDNAAYMVVLYNYDNKTPTYPQSIVFSNSDETPSEMLKNDTLDSYEYPMDAIKPSMGTIASADNKFIQNYWWVGSYVGIEDCVFDKVTFEIGESGKMYYAFLTAYPELDQVVSFAGGATSTTELTGAVGEKISVSIPDDAVCLYIYRHDWNESAKAPIYCLPESVTFRKISTLDKLQDPSRDEFSYPMNEVVSAGGCVIYWDENGKDITNGDHLFLENAYNKGVGTYQCAFIEITDTVFNYVSFRNNNVKTTGWAFLSNRPGEGEAAQYVGYQGFLWSGSTNPFNVEIPDGANYLAIWYEESKANYVPESITFSKNPIDPVRFLQDSSSEYLYPMGAFTPQSTVVHYDNYEYVDHANWKVAIIDITKTTFNQILLTNVKKDGKYKYMGWTFLKEAPVYGEKVEFAEGYSNFQESYNATKTIDIPKDAKYFVYWYQDSNTSQFVPASIKFIKKD